MNEPRVKYDDCGEWLTVLSHKFNEQRSLVTIEAVTCSCEAPT